MADKFEPSFAVGDKNTWEALVRSMQSGGIGLVDASGEKTAISSDFVSGGSSLPEVSADDNGDVLTVVSGEWAKAAPSGGSSNIEILHRDEDYFLNVSYNDLLSMLNNGVIPFYVDVWEDGALLAPLINLNYDGGNYVATFMENIFTATTATDPLVMSE